MSTTQLEFMQMSGSEFVDAITHAPDARVLLSSPKLKYYFPWDDWAKPEPVVREVFLATQKVRDKKDFKIVGMIELTLSPFSDKEVWLMFISVDPAFQRQGVSRELLTMLIAYLKETGKLLVRSRSSEFAPEGFQDFVDKMLNDQHIPWRQGERSANLT